jgi:hypothetical protein
MVSADHRSLGTAARLAASERFDRGVIVKQLTSLLDEAVAEADRR